jgi:hypothetical protein
VEGVATAVAEVVVVVVEVEEEEAEVEVEVGAELFKQEASQPPFCEEEKEREGVLT